MAGRTAGATRNALSASERGQGALRAAKPTTDAPTALAGPLRAVYDAMPERELQRTIRAYLTRRRFVVWVVPMMKRTRAGLPDLTFWHPARPGLLWCWELKAQRGRVRPEQVAALAHLATVPGVDARIVRPSDWDGLRDALEVTLEAAAPAGGGVVSEQQAAHADAGAALRDQGAGGAAVGEVSE